MALQIITADQRNSAAHDKTTAVIMGPPGIGKTSLLKTIDPDDVLAIDLEAGMKAVRGFRGVSIPVRQFTDFVTLACLIGGPNPAADPSGFYSQAHYDHVAGENPDLVKLIASRKIMFIDSITDLSRLLMAWAKQQPEAFSDKTGKPDVRGAYGLIGREGINTLKHIQHAPGKSTIFVGVLERTVDEFGRETFGLQVEGGKIGRELPGIVDQVISYSWFDYEEATGFKHNFEKGKHRAFVCQSGNGFGLPAKDRGGLDLIEPPDLGALLTKLQAGTTTGVDFPRPAPAVAVAPAA